MKNDGLVRDQEMMSNWLKGLIQNTMEGTPVADLMKPESPRGNTKIKIKSAFSYSVWSASTECYEFHAPYDRAYWLYHYHRAEDILYLANSWVSHDATSDVADAFYKIFPTSKKEAPIRPETTWLSHDTMFIQRGYFMKMSGETSQVKTEFAWERIESTMPWKHMGIALALKPNKKIAAAWYDVYSDDALPLYLSDTRVWRIHSVQQQVTGEWRIFFNVPMELIRGLKNTGLNIDDNLVD